MVVTKEQDADYLDEVRNDEPSNFNCPVCLREFSDLGLLNSHLDADHGFGGDTVPEPSPIKIKGHHRKEHVIASHLKVFEPGKSRCFKCGKLLRKGTGIVNCHSCGELFCKNDCRSLIKVDNRGRYEPYKGKWCVCCYRCFSERPGYNDYGSSRDLTQTLKSLRTIKNEDKQLQILQLENRLVRLVDGIVLILRECKGTLFESVRINKEITKLEKTVTSWRDDKEVANCYICEQAFDITLRRHHCRLCGNVVCDRRSSACSNLVPIRNLMNAAYDLSFTERGHGLVADSVSLRVCSSCTHRLFFQRKFRKDTKRPLPPLLALCESICNTSQAIMNLLPQLTALLGETERLRETKQAPLQGEVEESTRLRAKLLRAVASYNHLTRQLSTVRPSNNAEKKIQQSVRMASSLFIDEKILQLKSLPSTKFKHITQATESNSQDPVKLADFIVDNLSIKEIKEIKQYREELMVLKEQVFLVETMMENAKRQRNFEETNILNENLQELKSRIVTIQEYLGDQSFA